MRIRPCARLVAVQVMPQAAQERLVAAVAVIDGVEQLIAGQLARVGEGLLQLGFECPDLLVVGFGCPGPADEIVVGAVVGFGSAVGGGHGDQRRERPVRMPLPVERAHANLPSRQVFPARLRRVLFGVMADRRWPPRAAGPRRAASDWRPAWQ